MSFSEEQLVFICRVLCLPLWDYSRQVLVEAIMNFLFIPQMIDLKQKGAPISFEEFRSYDFSKIYEQMLQETKAAEMEVTEVKPDIHISEEKTIPCLENKEHHLKSLESKPIKTEERKIGPDIHTHNQTLVMTPFTQHIISGGNNYFSKAMEIPNVLQPCQNYDFRYQRELLKSGVTLNLNPNDYLEQAIGDDDKVFRLACVKYLRSYHTDPHQQLSRRQHCQETDDQAATRRAQNAMRMRNYRQSLRALETEQQAAERRAQNALRMRNYRKFKRELEPELAAERRAQNAERMRNYRKIKRELEPEKAAYRKEQNALRMRNYRKSKREQES